MESLTSYWRSLASSLANVEVNWGPRSDIKESCRPNEDVGEKEFGHFHGVDGFGTRDDNYPLRKAVVDHDQDRVLATDFREVGD